MLTQSDWQPIVRLALEETNKAIDRLVDKFAPKLQAWLDDILNHPIPEDWRDELAAFVQRTADDDNLAIAPHSITTLEELIESCIAGTDDFAEFGPAPRGPTRSAAPQLAASVATEGDTPPAKPQPLPPLVGYPDIPVGRRGPAVNAEKLFDRQLASAKQHFAVLDQLLKAAGDKIDAAKPGEEADVGYEAEMVQEHLFLYNEDLAVARDLWLRFNLSGDANSRLDAMPLPVVLGLPPFASPAQAQRMGQQLAAVNRRLHGQNASMDALVVGMQTTEMAATAAGIVSGAGAVIVAAKRGGKWAVMKLVAAGAAAIVADRAADAGLRAAGASDQTIRGVRLAAAVITLILLRRVSKRATPEEPTTEQPSVAGQAPPTGTPPPREPRLGASAEPRPSKPALPPERTPEQPGGPNQILPGAQPPASAPPRSAPPANAPSAGKPTGPTPPKPVTPPPSKPPLPPPRSNRRYKWWGHRTAAEAEEALARTIHELPDEVVVRWGDPIGSHGADVISVNIKTGKVTLWDSKFRSRSERIQGSKTFEKPSTRAAAIDQARKSIEADATLPSDIRAAALKSLKEGQVTTRTVGAGNAKNSTLR